jgi:hypothetical protein
LILLAAGDTNVGITPAAHDHDSEQPA